MKLSELLDIVARKYYVEGDGEIGGISINEGARYGRNYSGDEIEEIDIKVYRPYPYDPADDLL